MTEILYHFRDYLYCHKQNIGGNMDIKCTASEAQGNEEHVIGNWRKGDPCYLVAENLNCVLHLCRKQNL